MTGRLAGKRVLVTAAAQGIGRATAIAMAREGALVLATDINATLLVDLEAEERREHRSSGRHRQRRDRQARPGARPRSTFWSTSQASFIMDRFWSALNRDYDFSMNLNVKSMYRLIQALLPAMLDRGGGSIVNVASVCSSLKGLPNRFIYGTSKAAVIGLTKSVAADYVRQGVRCNAIAPGTVESPSLDERIAAFDDPEAARREFIARQPMGRLGTPEEIAAIAVYLASDESAYTTGQVFIVDGGITI